jgi:hypothetical protein
MIALIPPIALRCASRLRAGPSHCLAHRTQGKKDDKPNRFDRFRGVIRFSIYFLLGPKAGARI